MRPDSQLCEHDDIFLPNIYLKFPAEYEAGELKGGTSAHRAHDYVRVTFVENSGQYGALACALVSGPASPQAPHSRVQSQAWYPFLSEVRTLLERTSNFYRKLGPFLTTDFCSNLEWHYM